MAIQSIDSFGKGMQAPVAAPQGGAQQVVAPQSEAPKPQATPPASPASQEQLQKALEQMKSKVEPMVSNNLKFSLDESTGKTIVRVVDSSTGNVIRQIPSEELLAIAESLDRMQGLLLRQKA